MTTPNLIAGQSIAGAIGIDVYSGNAIAAAPGTGGSSNPGISGTAGTAGVNVVGAFPAMLVSNDGNKATYQAGVAGFTPVATPTAFLYMAGSATKTITIKRIRIAGVATAAGNMPVQFQRWSTVGTQGSATLTALTVGKHDIQDPTATFAPSIVQTANWTTQGTGTAVPFLCDRLYFSIVATGAPIPNEWNFCQRSDKGLILRGATDILVISGAGGAVPAGGILDVSIEWEECNR